MPVSSGFFVPLNRGGVATVEAVRTTQTHVSIDDRYRTAQDAALYSVQALERYQDFSGRLIVRDHALVPMLKKLVNQFAQETLAVGGGVSRGLGAVNLTWRERAHWLPGSVSERLEAFQVGAPQGRLRFALLLQDDAILLKPETGAPVVGLQPDLIRAALSSVPLRNLEAVVLMAKSAVISGWNSKWQTPKWNALATLKGAVGLYEIDCPADSDRSDLVQGLERLEFEGLGERRLEGLGQVVVCHPVHLEGGADGKQRAD